MTSSTLTIADVSEFQRGIDWAKYGASTPAAIVRVHNGWRADYWAAANIAGARAHCAWRGWYQYLPAAVDPAAAAQAFAATLGPLRAGEVLILDLEEGSGDQRSRAAAWHAAMHRLYGAATEWTYSGAYFARAHLGGSVDWVASYGSPEPTSPHALWQFTDARSFPGIAGTCDGSIFHGTVTDLLALTGASTTTQPTTTQEDDMLTDQQAQQLAALATALPSIQAALADIQNHANQAQNYGSVDLATDRAEAASVAQGFDALKAQIAALPQSTPPTIDQAELDAAVSAAVAKALAAHLSGTFSLSDTTSTPTGGAGSGVTDGGGNTSNPGAGS